MDAITAVNIIEGFEEPSSFEEYVSAWQYIYTNNLHLHLQGFYQRGVNDMLNQGLIS